MPRRAPFRKKRSMKPYPVRDYAKEITQLMFEDNLEETFAAFYEILTSGEGASRMIAEDFLLKDSQLVSDPDLVTTYRNQKRLTDHGDKVATAVGRILQQKAHAIENLLNIAPELF